jgi:hypothetical protein
VFVALFPISGLSLLFLLSNTYLTSFPFTVTRAPCPVFLAPCSLSLVPCLAIAPPAEIMQAARGAVKVTIISAEVLKKKQLDAIQAGITTLVGAGKSVRTPHHEPAPHLTSPHLTLRLPRLVAACCFVWLYEFEFASLAHRFFVCLLESFACLSVCLPDCVSVCRSFLNIPPYLTLPSLPTLPYPTLPYPTLPYAQVEIVTQVNESILGGLQVMVGDKFLDLSVAARVADLNKSLESSA